MQWEYPADLEKQKLSTLTEIFFQHLGKMPTSFRAGRFGIGHHTGKCLKELGYLIDSSVTPHIVWTSSTGVRFPDFTNFTELPYMICDDGDIWKQGNSNFLELPITALREGIISNEVSWLRPWYSDGKGLCDIFRHIYKNEPKRPNVMMFHNVEVIPSASPYPKTEADVERYLNMLHNIFQLALNMGAIFCTMSEFYHIYKNGA